MRVAVSDTTGDIAFITTINKLYFYTINCEFIGIIDKIDDFENDLINRIEMKSLCFSNAHEGISINVIAVGLSNGHIYLYSTWDLTLIRKIAFNNLENKISSISSMVYSNDSKRLYVLDTNSRIFIIECFNSNPHNLSSSILVQDYE